MRGPDRAAVRASVYENICNTAENPAGLRWQENRALARQPGLCYDTKDPGLWARDLLIGKDLEVL